MVCTRLLDMVLYTNHYTITDYNSDLDDIFGLKHSWVTDTWLLLKESCLKTACLTTWLGIAVCQ